MFGTSFATYERQIELIHQVLEEKFSAYLFTSHVLKMSKVKPKLEEFVVLKKCEVTNYCHPIDEVLLASVGLWNRIIRFVPSVD